MIEKSEVGFGSETFKDRCQTVTPNRWKVSNLTTITTIQIILNNISAPNLFTRLNHIEKFGNIFEFFSFTDLCH